MGRTWRALGGAGATAGTPAGERRRRVGPDDSEAWLEETARIRGEPRWARRLTTSSPGPRRDEVPAGGEGVGKAEHRVGAQPAPSSSKRSARQTSTRVDGVTFVEGA